jgi:tetratricopeptide (TPR) repeat protein
MPDLLTGLARVPEETVAQLKNEVTTYLARSRSNASSSRAPPTPAPVIPAGSSATGPRLTASLGSRSSSSGSGTGRGFPSEPPPPTAASPLTPTGQEEPTLADAQKQTRRDDLTATATSRFLYRPKVGTRFGRYDLVAELGRGGMGIVCRARQVDLGREVAIKMLLEGSAATPVGLRRFYAEARSVAKLSHPNIVAVHDVGEQDGVPYFTMDYIDGRPLGELIERGELSAERSVSIARALAHALAYAHGQRVIHRDLKPPNVLIDRKGEPKLTDFGIAKDLSTTQVTQEGEFLGTPSYMPPEQAKGHAADADARSDVYSLGAVLFEMLTGRPPFVGQSAYETMSAVVNDPPPRLRTLVPSLAPELEAIVLKCLEKNRDARYQTAADLAADLDRFARGDSVEAPRPSWFAGIDWSRTLSRGAAAGVILAALGATVAAIVIQQRRTAEEAATAAALEKAKADAARALVQEREAEAARARARERARVLVQAALDAAAHDDPEVALARAVDAATAAPDLALAHSTLARLYLDLRRDGARARTSAEAALTLEPLSIEARVVLARVFAQEGKYDEAATEIGKLDVLGPDARFAAARLRGQLAIARGDSAGAVPELQRAAALEPQDVSIRLELARAALSVRRYLEAEGAADEACRLDPGRAPAFVLRAQARAGLGRSREALDDARRGQTLDPEDPIARDLVAKFETAGLKEHERAGHDALHAAAEAALKSAQSGKRAAVEAWLAKPPDKGECGMIMSIRAGLLWQLGRLQDAEREYTRAHAVDPNNMASLGNRGLVRQALHRYEDALSDFDAALAPGCPQGMLPAAIGRAQVLAQLERWDLALAAWTRALEATRDSKSKANVLHERAHTWFTRESWAEAEKDLDQAIALDPSKGHYLVVRGDVHARQGESTKAVADWRAALEKPLASDEAARVRASIAALEPAERSDPK